MKKRTLSVGLTIALMAAGAGLAQMPQPAEEHAILKHDVGEWDASIRMLAPGMPTEPQKGKEINTMIGDLWVNSVFTMDFMGTPFVGQATLGYDERTKQYVGSWVDSTSARATHMKGTFDSETRTMTMMTEGPGPDGKDRQGKMTTTYSDNGNTRVMTMYDRTTEADSEWVKSMEITYTRAKK